MAVTTYGVNAPEAQKLWSRRVAEQAIAKTYFGRFMGESASDLIQIYPETGRDKGDRVRVPFRGLLTSDGVGGDGKLKGNEESLTTFTDDVLIDQTRNAVNIGGRMSRQRVPWDIREQAEQALSDWFAEVMDDSFFKQLGGDILADDSNLTRTGNNAVTTIPVDTYHFRADAAGTHFIDSSVDDDDLVAGDTMRLKHIDQLVAKAKQASPIFKPIRANGQDFFVMFLGTNAALNLRIQADAVHSWQAIQQAAISGGQVENNPIFTGALGVYNNVIIHESTRVPGGITVAGAAKADTERNIFCGAQAAAVAFGMDNGPERFTWVEELDDFENELGIAVGSIFGMKQLTFNSKPHANFIFSTHNNSA